LAVSLSVEPDRLTPEQKTEDDSTHDRAASTAVGRSNTARRENAKLHPKPVFM